LPELCLTCWLIGADSTTSMNQCRVPVTVKPGDVVAADFGVLGKVCCRFD
jgi:hypothetical protein